MSMAIYVNVYVWYDVICYNIWDMNKAVRMQYDFCKRLITLGKRQV